MKVLFSVILFLIVAFQGKSQFVNNGGTVTVQNGGIIFCNGDFLNNAGTVANNGKIEVQGNFQNSSSYSSTGAEDSLIISGSTNSTISSGNETLNYLSINKSSATNQVTLLGTVKVGKGLNYAQGMVTTDPIANPSAVLSAPVSASFSFAAGKEITGRVRRTSWANGSTIVPFNQTNMGVFTSGGTAPSDVTVLMIPQDGGGNPSLLQREVKRRYEFSHIGGTGFSANVRFAYQETELNNNTEANLKPWLINNSIWSVRPTGTVTSASNFASLNSISASDFAREWKLADPVYRMEASVLLQGAWLQALNGMYTVLNEDGILPLTQPYNQAPFNYAGTESVATIPNSDVVDWVLVELRNPASKLPEDADPSTVIGRKAGFLLSNGTVVNPDGITPLSFNISRQDSSFLVIRHRNHLGIISKLRGPSETGTFTNDFTIASNVFQPEGASTLPVTQLAGSTKYGMWAGDANSDGGVNIGDINAAKLAASLSQDGYRKTDVNMDNAINIVDVNLMKLIASLSAEGSGSRPANSAKPKSFVP